MRGSIQHRPDRLAPWRARYRGPDGRLHSKSFDRKIDAERWLRATLAKLDRGEWVAPETVAKTMRWVRLTLNQAVRDRRILSSPAQDLRLPQVRRTDMRILTPDQVASLAQALPDRYESLVVVAAYTGLRWGELAGLRTSDIDLLRRRLTVQTALIEASGQPPILGTPKTSTSERTITLPNIVIDALTDHLEQHPPIDEMVWTTQQGGFLRRGSLGRIWRQTVAGTVGPPCCIHDLRHTHAAWLIAAGEHPKAIQSRLGHSSIQVTIDRYGHLMDGLDDQTADRLDAIAQSVRGSGVAQATQPVDLQTRRNPR